MITCGVCGKENDDLSVVCSSCKGFLQGRRDALDLFATAWGLLESPKETMKRIVLAKHKNYAVLLGALFGIYLAFEVAWYRSLAVVFEDLLTLVGFALVAGPILGWTALFFATVVLLRVSRSLGGNGTRKNLFAVLSYATVPVVCALVLVIPLQIAVFGLDFFGTNPPPIVIKPVEYVLMLGLKAVLTAYSVYLFVEGTIAANGFGRSKLVPVMASVVAVLAAGFGALHFLRV